jgi:hypothetical protein
VDGDVQAGAPEHGHVARAGLDGRTGAEYAKNLEANLQSLLDRVKSGKYRAPVAMTSSVQILVTWAISIALDFVYGILHNRQ